MIAEVDNDADPADGGRTAESALLECFAAAVAGDIEATLERLAAHSEAPAGSRRADAEAFVARAIGGALQRSGGLDELATRPPLPGLDEVAEPDQFFLAAEEYLQLILFMLREQAFVHFGGDIERCRQLIDLLHAIALAFRRHLLDWRNRFRGFGAELDRDLLSDLPGPQTLLRKLGRLIESRQSSREPLALIIVELVFPVLDIDLSPAFSEAARRLRGAVQTGDIVGRLDDRSFAVILTHIGDIEVSILAATKIQRALGTSYVVDGLRLAPETLSGIAVYPDHSAHASALFSFAAAARDAARGADEAILMHDPAASREAQQRHHFESRLRAALQDNELEMHFQPKANLRTRSIFGAEALLRWQPEGERPIGVHEVLALAKTSGKQRALSRWIVNAALRELSGLIQQEIPLELSINITSDDLLDPEFPDFVGQALGTWKIPPKYIVLELTEESMVGEGMHAIENMNRLKRLGVRLSIDDFGTGYSSLAYLRRMPLDELKIDQIFIRNLLTVDEDAQIVRTIIDLARHFNLTVIAEGVEDLATAHKLAEIGCFVVQGYWLAKPMPVEEFASWWRQCSGRLPEDVDQRGDS